MNKETAIVSHEIINMAHEAIQRVMMKAPYKFGTKGFNQIQEANSLIVALKQDFLKEYINK